MTTLPTHLTVTINGKSRECEVRDACADGSRLDTVDNVALARVGRGAKLWPTSVSFWRQKDGSYRQGMGSTHLNQQARVVYWNEEQLKKYLSQHNSAQR